MNRVYTEEVPEESGKKVKVSGWIDTKRALGKIIFLILRDRKGKIQLIIKKKEVGDELFEKVKELTEESVISATGKVELNEEAPGGIEIKPEEIEILNKSEASLPIDFSDKVNTSLSKRLDWRYLDLRNPDKLLIFKVLNTVERAMKEYCYENGLIEINTPKLMSIASETGAELFELDYFEDRKAYLAQSPQIYKQMAVASGMEKVFEQGPVFRANPSHTSRHDTEFTMFDVELGFIDSEEDVMKFEEKWLQYIFKKVKEKHGEEINKTFGVEVKVPETPFPRVTWNEALEELRKNSKGEKPSEIGSNEEKEIGKYINEKENHEFVFLTEFPYEERPFYHMKKENNLEVTKSFDLLFKGLEITTGAQREHRHEKLMKQIKEKGMEAEKYKFYLDMFKYGCPPHGGYAVSPTRIVMKILELGNVRESTLFPRDTERLKP
ncbi:MAG: aspartate--tRNA(Asn) ligase [archaeon]